MRQTITILLLIIANVSFAQLDVLQIIDKHYKTCKTLELIDTIKQFEADAILKQNNSSTPIHIKGKSPDMFRTDMKISNLDIVKISKGGQTTQYNPLIDSAIVTNCSKQALIDFVKLWAAVIDTSNNTNLELIGEDKIEDIDVYQIQVDIGKLSTTYFVDKLSFLVLRIDENTGKTTTYQDYRQLDKYIVPYRFSVYSGDSPNITTQFKTINLQAEIADTDFEWNIKDKKNKINK